MRNPSVTTGLWLAAAACIMLIFAKLPDPPYYPNGGIERVRQTHWALRPVIVIGWVLGALYVSALLGPLQLIIVLWIGSAVFMVLVNEIKERLARHRSARSSDNGRRSRGV